MKKEVTGTVAKVEVAQGAYGELRQVTLTDGQLFPTTYSKHSLVELSKHLNQLVKIEVSPKGYLYSISSFEQEKTPNEILTYHEMCAREGVEKFFGGIQPYLSGKHSVVLMSRQPDGAYIDDIRDDGRTLIYAGQKQSSNIAGKLTNNGEFEKLVLNFKLKGAEPRLVRVYEKLKDKTWAYNGIFSLIDCWQENGEFRFKLTLRQPASRQPGSAALPWNRIIPGEVKREVWARDQGKCVACGVNKNLHFDHILPFSKGGTSLTAKNIQLLCMDCNIEKSDRIE